MREVPRQEEEGGGGEMMVEQENARKRKHGYADDDEDESVSSSQTEGSSASTISNESAASSKKEKKKKRRVVLHRGWDDDEDSALIEAVKEHGEGNWGEIARELVGRTWNQCRDRWHHHLLPSLNKIDDQQIFQTRKDLDRKCTEIPRRLLPGQTDTSTQHRCLPTLKRTGFQASREEQGKKRSENTVVETVNRLDSPSSSSSVLHNHVLIPFAVTTPAMKNLIQQPVSSFPTPSVPLGSRTIPKQRQGSAMGAQAAAAAASATHQQTSVSHEVNPGLRNLFHQARAEIKSDPKCFSLPKAARDLNAHLLTCALAERTREILLESQRNLHQRLIFQPLLSSSRTDSQNFATTFPASEETPETPKRVDKPLHGTTTTTPTKNKEKEPRLFPREKISPSNSERIAFLRANTPRLYANGRAVSGAYPGTENTGRWSDEEHKLFLRGLKLHGRKNWTAIADVVRTRTVVQVRTHAQKYFAKRKLDQEPGE